MDWLEGYRLIDRMGGNGPRKFGAVYRGEELATEKAVIIKCVEKSRATAAVLAAIRNEATYSFASSGLPNVLQFIENENECILIKRMQPGIPLTDFWKGLSKRERTPFILKFVSELAQLLDELHAANLFHCDLKPSNILIHREGDQVRVELIDFGLAIRQPVSPRLLVFPLGYAAPELILNRLDLVDRTTDYFSLGIVLWKLFTDSLPLQHPNPSIYTNLQLVHPIPDHSKLPRKLYTIIDRLTCKPAFKTAPNRLSEEVVRLALREAQCKRYATSSALLDDLQEIRTSWFRFF